MEVAIRDLFAHPVLSGSWPASLRAPRHASFRPITPAARERAACRLSFAQQRLWFLAQMEGVSQAYHIPLGLRLKGELDAARCARRWTGSWRAMRRCAPSSAMVDGEPVQRIAAAAGQPLPSCRARSAPAQRCRRRNCTGWRQRKPSAAFDLEAGPLIRGRLDPAGRRRACAADHHAPHRLRRLVDGGASATN